jgi:V/A-type H+/Na+-transporting ATPase subunit G/H
MIDSLKKIKEAEQRAAERIEATRKDSAATLARAQDDARKLIEKACADASARSSELMATACRTAEAEAEKIIAEGVERSRQVKQSGQARVEAAAQIVVSRIIGDA